MRMEGVVLHLATLLLILLALCAIAATAELIAGGGSALDRGNVDGAAAQVCLPASASPKTQGNRVNVDDASKERE